MTPDYISKKIVETKQAVQELAEVILDNKDGPTAPSNSSTENNESVLAVVKHSLHQYKKISTYASRAGSLVWVLNAENEFKPEELERRNFLNRS